MFFLLLLIGNIWRDPINEEEEQSSIRINELQRPSAAVSRLIYSTAFAVIGLLVWPFVAAAMEQRAVTPSEAIDELRDLSGWQTVVPESTNWRPLDGGADWANEFYVRRDNTEIQIVVHQYYQQNQGKELVPGQKLLIPESRGWRAFRKGDRSVELRTGVLTVNETVMKHPREERLVWQWYWVGSEFTGAPHEVKLIEAWQKISFGRQDAARLYLSIPLSHESDALSTGREKLTEFLEVGLPALEKSFRECG